MTPASVAELLARLRKRRPRVHALTNTVVQMRTADGLSALGVVPSMTVDPDEIDEVAGAADALLVNLGTLDRSRRDAIEIAVTLFAGSGRPWVLDPVKCDIAERRRVLAAELIRRSPSLVRANAEEMRALSPTGARFETGATDQITVGQRTISVANGHPWLALVTGTGCLSGAITAAFLAVEDDPLQAAVATAVVLGIAAEKGAARAAGPGTFAATLLDALVDLSSEDILTFARISG